MNQPLQPYWWKPRREAIRAVVVAVALVVLQTITQTNFQQVEDWHTWLVGLGTGALVAGAYAMRAQLGPGGIGEPQAAQAAPGAPQAPAPDVAPVAPPAAPVVAIQPLQDDPRDPYPYGHYWGTNDVRTGLSRPAQPPAPAAVQPAPPAPTADELRHQQRSASAQKGWATRRAAATPPPAAPDKPRARVRG